MAFVLAPPLLERPPSRRQRRRLAELDRLAAHLTGLEQVRAVVAGAAAVVATGWVRHGWFSCRDGRGAEHLVTARDAHLLADRPVTGACLVGAVVQAGGGLAAVGTQPVQRALDLTWHALQGDPDRPVRWCPAPAVRAQHVRELTGWNDTPGRTADEVAGLLARADRTVGVEIDRTRRARAALAGRPG
jgi:hypothetical protein